MDWSFDENPVPPRPRLPRTLCRIGRFEVRGDEDLIGVGGMGMVYRAFDPVLLKNVAIKVIIPELASAYNQDLFVKELRALAQFRHQHIAIIYEPGFAEVEGQSILYFAMELIPNALPLSEFARRHNLDFEQRLDLLLAAVRAVEAVHGQRYVHSDIKPSNILVGDDGQPKLVDFGIAAFLGDAQEIPSHGFFSAGYSAPELLREAVVCKASDVFSLACVAYDLFAEHSPFSVPVKFDANTQRSAPFAYPAPVRINELNPKISWRIADVLTRALKFSPTERYPDASSFRSDLEIARKGGLPSGSKKTPWNRAVGYWNEHRKPLAISAMLMTLLTLGIVGTTSQALVARRERDAANQAAIAEKEARLVAEGLRRSSDRHMQFIEDLLFAADSYNVGDQRFDIDFMLRQAQERLPLLAGDSRAEALVLGALGRIASNWGKHELGATWLNRSASLWKRLAEPDLSEPPARPTTEETKRLAAVLNHLAWATLGNQDNPTNLTERASAAAVPAHEAYVLLAKCIGENDDNTLALHFDWLRILAITNSGAAITDFIGMLAHLAGTDQKTFLSNLSQTIREVSSPGTQPDEAKKRIRLFLAPLLSDARPRLRQRAPWSIAQVANYAAKQPYLAFLLSVSPDALRHTASLTLQVSDELAAEVLGEGHPDRKKIAALLSGLSQ